MRNTVIKNGRVFDGTRFINADLLLCDGKIAGIGEYSSEDAYDGDYLIDARGMIVCAGLVDIHTHIRSVSPDWLGAPAEEICFPYGVTAAVDGGAAKGSCEMLGTMNVKTAVFVSTTVENDKVNFCDTNRMLSAYGDCAIGVKILFDTTMKQVHSIEPLREVCAYARERGLKVMVHCSHSPVPMYDIVDTLREGDILTHIYHGDENTCDVDGYSAFKLARSKGVVLDVGMAGHIHTDFNILKRAVEGGMYPDTVSSDNYIGFAREGGYGLLTCMSVMRSAGMKEEELLRAVTENAARAVGKSGEWGMLCVGARADIAVLEWTDAPYAFLQNKNNVTAGSEGYVCRFTVCDGRVVYRS